MVIIVIIVLCVIFYVLIEAQKTNPTCLEAVTSCAYGAIKGNGVQLDLSNPVNASIMIFLTICVILLAVFVADLIYNALHNRPAQTEVKPNRTDKQPYWLDDSGNSQAIAAIQLLLGLFVLVFVGYLAFNFMIVQHADSSHITNQVNNNISDFVMQVKIELWKLSQLVR